MSRIDILKKFKLKGKAGEDYRILLLKARYTYQTNVPDYENDMYQIAALHQTFQQNIMQGNIIPEFIKDPCDMTETEFDDFYNKLRKKYTNQGARFPIASIIPDIKEGASSEKVEREEEKIVVESDIAIDRILSKGTKKKKTLSDAERVKSIASMHGLAAVSQIRSVSEVKEEKKINLETKATEEAKKEAIEKVVDLANMSVTESKPFEKSAELEDKKESGIIKEEIIEKPKEARLSQKMDIVDTESFILKVPEKKEEKLEAVKIEEHKEPPKVSDIPKIEEKKEFIIADDKLSKIEEKKEIVKEESLSKAEEKKEPEKVDFIPKVEEKKN